MENVILLRLSVFHRLKACFVSPLNRPNDAQAHKCTCMQTNSRMHSTMASDGGNSCSSSTSCQIISFNMACSAMCNDARQTIVCFDTEIRLQLPWSKNKIQRVLRRIHRAVSIPTKQRNKESKAAAKIKSQRNKRLSNDSRTDEIGRKYVNHAARCIPASS